MAAKGAIFEAKPTSKRELPKFTRQEFEHRVERARKLMTIEMPPGDAKRIHDILYHATDAGIKAVRPGNTAADVFHAQAKVLMKNGIEPGKVGRLGHGLGKVMTESPSIRPEDKTKLVPGMVLTVEPSAMFGSGNILVHEENVVITKSGARLLSRRAPREMPVIEF